MKKYIFLFVSLLITATTSFADEVNPDGEDAWKSLVVTIKQLDIKKLPTPQNLKAQVYIYFGDQTIVIDASKIEQGQDVVKKLTIPKASRGKYQVRYYGPSPTEYASYGGNRLDTILQSGEIVEGTKNVEARLKHIDVNHMKVTRDDGTTYITANGQASISYLHNDKLNLINAFKTGYAMDVPTGEKYTVNVTAVTEDGNDEYTTTLDFTNL